jgi:hypothetical protein
MKVILFALFVGMLMVFGCATTPQIISKLYSDLDMPFYTTKDQNQPSEYRLIKTISVSAGLAESSASSSSGDYRYQALIQELLLEASSVGANSVIDAKISNDISFEENRFGEKIKRTKVKMTGKAIFVPNHKKKYINTLIVDAFHHKYKNYTPTAGIPLLVVRWDRAESTDFYLCNNNQIAVDILDVNHATQPSVPIRKQRLFITNEEIRRFANENYSYRWRHTQVRVED